MNGAIIGLVPARGGSKGILRKNLLRLAGRPLLEYTATAARSARTLARTLLSTDDSEIAAAGRGLGLDVPFLRPAELARDDTPMLPVMIHALDWLEAQGTQVDAIVLLQPTSPLRKAAHIDGCVERLMATGADTAVSVVEVPHQFNPVSVMTSEGGYLRPFFAGDPVLRRQDKPRVFARNGPAVLAVRAATLRAGKLYGERIVGFEMPASESHDIDTIDDLRLIEALLRERSE